MGPERPEETDRDVPSPIDPRVMSDAREWAAKAEQRPGPDILAQPLLQRLPEARHRVLHLARHG